MNHPDLIVMLTKDDKTVKNAFLVFEKSKESQAKLWGFKELGLSLPEMKELFSYIKKCGKTAILEVVAYNELECINSAKIAAYCGCDILMGSLYFDSVNDICKIYNIKYMPFVGKVYSRPSILEGSIEEIINEAKKIAKKGVYGFDLLGYRYIGDSCTLNKEFISEINNPVCLAGSINSFKRIDEVLSVNPTYFTIGSAFFENKFNGTINDQINKVCSYIDNYKLVRRI